jgi:dCTP deaminase
MAFISMRTAIKFAGLINVSGFHVDPGYTGRLAFAVYNASPSPIQITEGERLFKIWFSALDQESKKIFAAPGLTDITGDMVRGMNREILSLQSLAEQLREQKSEIKELVQGIETKIAEQKPTIDNLQFVWRGLTIGVVAAIGVGIASGLFLIIKTILSGDG